MGSVAWLSNPVSEVSAHYVVMEDGELVAMVDEVHEAWHAGIIVGTPTTEHYDGTNPNLVSIGIEVAGYWDVPFPPQQLETTVALVKDIWSRYGALPVVKHSELSPGNRRDPGNHNYNAVMEVVEKDMAYDEDAVKATMRTMLLSPEGANLVEFAVARPGGFGDKLADAMGRRVEQAVRDAMAESLKS